MEAHGEFKGKGKFYTTENLTEYDERMNSDTIPKEEDVWKTFRNTERLPITGQSDLILGGNGLFINTGKIKNSNKQTNKQTTA
jgi:hypothetical protein